jgi:hypothetical protein
MVPGTRPCVPGQGCRGQAAVAHCTKTHVGTALKRKPAAPEGVCCAGAAHFIILTRQLPLILSRSNVPAGRAALKAPASAVDDLAPLVESAMLAAMTGLAYHFSASFRLESYLGALFPFPVVLAAARWGCDAAWKTLVGLTVC